MKPAPEYMSEDAWRLVQAAKPLAISKGAGELLLRHLFQACVVEEGGAPHLTELAELAISPATRPHVLRPGSTSSAFPRSHSRHDRCGERAFHTRSPLGSS